MCLHVRLECIRLYTQEVGLCAAEKLVLFELIGSFARKVALLTVEMLFYRIYELASREVRSFCAGGLTLRAEESLFS